MSVKDKLHDLEGMAAAIKTRWQASAVVVSSQNNPCSEDESVDSSSASAGKAVTPAAEVERENEATTANQALSPLSVLDLDTAIRLRWALRDIKGKRTKLTPVSPDDLRALVEMGLVEMRDDVPVLTNEGHRVLD
jgi:hypothetical protein